MGHVPKSVSKMVSCFLRYDDNTGFCGITGSRVNRDVGLGVEVPCVYKFYGRAAYIDKLKILLESSVVV